MKSKTTSILTLLLLFIWQVGSAQHRIISGSVVDQNDLPLPGVNIIVKGTATGTQSDFDGNFSIAVSDGQTIEFSFIGYVNHSVTVNQLTTTLNIVMSEDAAVLEEVLVIGYGTQSKRRLTDNIAKIVGSDIAEIPTPTLQSALSGRAAGVRVAQTNGKVESGINIRVRGASSISASSEPLYVIDGIPVINSDQTASGGMANPLVSLSANEIESIDILKDASSASIYGSRAANGVILITTKKGKEGKAQFSVNVAHGVSNPANKREWMNANEYIEFFTEAAVNRFGDTGVNTAENLFRQLLGVPSDDAENWRNYIVDNDWQELAFQNGYTTDADFSMSGGDAKTTYFFSGAYNNTNGIIRGNELERVSARINLQHKFSNKFTAGMNMNYSRTLIDRIADDRQFVTPMQAIAQPALVSPYLENGEPNPNTLYPNFLLQDKHAFYNSLLRRITGNAYGEYKIFPFLKFKTDFGYELFSQQENAFTGSQAPFQSTNGEAWNRDVDIESYVYSNYFTFSKNINYIHDIEVIAGMEYNRSDYRSIYVEGIEFPSDDFQTIASAGEISGGSGVLSNFAFLSYFGRASYAYKNKYLFKASIRRDASSRFGSESRWGTFPSVSAGWIISEENFLIDSQKLSFLKLRASWGQVGNADGIGDHPWRYLFGVGTYNNRPGLVSTQAPNLNLSWEKQDQIDIGIEMGFLNNRIMLEVDYYNKQIDGLLFSEPLPWTSGEDDIVKNIGQMENKGVEFVLNTKNIDKNNFTWTTSINLSQNRNRVLRLPDGNDIPSDFNILREGEAINAFYLVEYAGVNPDNGDAIFYVNRDLTPDEMNDDNFFIKDGRAVTNQYNAAERVVSGQPLPDWIGGLTNTIVYKGFDFSFTLQGEWGASIYNYGGRFQSSNGLFEDNQTRDQLNRWQQPGDITDVPQARWFLNNGGQHSTRYLQRADFVRLRNITIGYTIPQQALEKSGFSRVRVYATAFNLLTFTNYDGYDPEARDDSTALGVARGLDFYSAPAATTVTLGVNFNF